MGPFSAPRPHAARTFLLILLFVAAAAHAARAATLAGNVVDPQGRAVAGANVIVSGPLGTVAQAATDRAGAFAIDNVAPGEYVVRVSAAGLQADPVPVSVTDAGLPNVDFALRVSALSESVVVSAAQVDVPLSRAPDSVTVIPRRELEARQVETVADALRTVPGLSVIRSGGRGAITSIFPRGGNSNYTLVLVDGMRANSFGGGFDFAHLSTADVERIEIVRGPQSALFGSDAIGGVVNVVTRRGGSPRGDATIEGGSQSTMRTAVSGAGSSGAWTFGGGAEHTRSDGYTGIAPANGERVGNDDYRLTTASGSLGWQRPGGVDFLLVANLGRNERGFPGPFGADPIGAFPGVDRVSRGTNETRQAGVRFANPWTPRVRQRVEANYTDLTSDFVSQYGPSTSGTKRFDGRVQEDAAFSERFGGSAGVGWTSERGESSYITGAGPSPLPIDRAVLGAFAEGRYIKSERLFVTAGLRFERITRDALEGNPSAFSPRPSFAAQAVSSVNPKIAASYDLRGGSSPTRVHASAGTGIRPPDAFEIAFTDNPNLKPERSRSFDAGVEQHFAGGAVVAGATWFYNRYDDLIVAVGRALRNASRYRTDNISNAMARGLELTGDARVGAHLTVRAAYTFLDSEVLSVDRLAALAPPPFVVGDPLIRRPRHSGSIDLVYAAGRVTLSGGLATRSRVLDVEPNYGAFGGLFYSAGYGAGSAGATVRVIDHLDAYARVTNITDRRYEETLGYPALPRSFIAGVRVAAGR